MTVRAVIIDDERKNVDNVSALLAAYCPQVNVVGTAFDAPTGRQVILQLQPQLVFLDIQMPGESGFDLLRSLNRYNFEVIFITAYDMYGIQAVKFAALDYLLKPVNIAELQQAVDKAIARLQSKNQELQLENLVQLLQRQQHKEEHRIALPVLKETRFVYTRDIIRCEASNNYSRFFMTDGEELLVSRPIFEYEEILKEYGFLRCHQSHLVNKKFIKSWVKDDGQFLLLQNGMQVPISRNKKDMLARALRSDS
ncbi:MULTISPECIES: LytR/AlgR family response regulator transcription factor [Niastella]|uniref:Response regulator transcription factor n=1 Tax=Niastella soli TaxID=2821487 RepID=A0ABS3YXD9_9BACT|nr:LytTR family DNA-binding domain-containing protein [Niastella soli]MBO9202568.1 response regulator transcription factor [Niastella soli]